MRRFSTHWVRSGQVPQPLICRFHFFGDKRKVWAKRAKLKGTSVIMQEDFHPQIIQRRKALYPVFKLAMQQNLKAGLNGDRLHINQKVYTVNNLHELPDSLKACATGKRQSGNTVAFFGQQSHLSNFYRTSFIDDRNRSYHSSEQYFQHHKALFFDDQTQAEKIPRAEKPLDCMKLGKGIKHFDQKKWEAEACRVMKDALRLKFTSDATCRKELLATGTSRLAEASKHDLYFGTGSPLSRKHDLYE